MIETETTIDSVGPGNRMHALRSNFLELHHSSCMLPRFSNDVWWSESWLVFPWDVCSSQCECSPFLPWIVHAVT